MENSTTTTKAAIVEAIEACTAEDLAHGAPRPEPMTPATKEWATNFAERVWAKLSNRVNVRFDAIPVGAWFRFASANYRKIDEATGETSTGRRASIFFASLDVIPLP